MSFQKILVALNDSQLGRPVFSAAMELAQYNKASVMLIHCLTPEPVSEPMVPMTLDAGLPAPLVQNNYPAQSALLEQRIAQAQVMLQRYGEEATNQGLRAAFDYKIGEAGHEICEMARAWGADLIVVGRRGRTGLTEALLGSVSNYVVHHAPCAVLVIQEGTPESSVISSTDFLQE